MLVVRVEKRPGMEKESLLKPEEPKSEEGPGPEEEAEEEGEGFMGSMFGRFGTLVSQFYVLCEYSCTQFLCILSLHSFDGFT